MNSRATFTVAYDGPAIDGTMDVRELAPALLEMGQLLDGANRVLNGETYKIHVLVKSDFRTGSFEIGLEVVQSLVDAVRGMLELREQGVTASDILRILGFSASALTGGVGLVKLVKWLRGRPITNTVMMQDGDVMVYVDGNTDPIQVMGKALPLFRDVNVRRALEGIAKPLAQEGIERFAVRDQGRDVEVVERPERPYFDAPETPREDVLTTEYTFAYTLVTTSFDERLVWRLFDGTNRITALMKDETFLRQIDEGLISFSKGDVFLARMRLHQWREDGELKSEHHILEVLEHRRRQSYPQLPLPGTNTSPTEEGASDEDEEPPNRMA